MSDKLKYLLTFSLGLLSLLFIAALSLTQGPEGSNVHYTVLHVRTPRFLLASILGASLGLAGMLLQLCTKNPLSEPELLGINQSAVLAVVLATLFFGAGLSPHILLLAALLGGGVSGFAILSMTASGSFPRDRLILAGLTLAFFAGSASSGILLLRDTDLFELLHWIAGKLSGANWTDVLIAGIALALCVLPAMLRSQSWNVLQLGDDQAKNLGIEPVTLRIEMLVIIVVLCSVAVALAGPIGFVGIVVPHLSHMLVGLDYRRRIPVTLLSGALLVSLSDLIARTVVAPTELPVGILTAFVGAPYFLYKARQL